MNIRLFVLFAFLINIAGVCAQTDSVLTEADSLVLKELNVQNLDDKKSLTPKAKRLIARADNYMAKGPLFFERALESYLQALETDPDNSYLNLRTGLCYLQIKRLKSNSILYLEKAFNQNKKVDKKIHHYLAQAYQLNSNPTKAIKEYKVYQAELKKTSRSYPTGIAEMLTTQTEKKIRECELAIEAKKSRNKTTKIINLGDSVNSPYPDYQPFITPDEKILIFTSRRPVTKKTGRAELDGEYYEDIYVSYFDSAGYWSNAKNLANMFNKKTNDAIVGLSYDATRMLLYRDTEGGDIYFSEYVNEQWSRPRKLKNVNSAYHEPSGTFSPDLKELYFVSNKPGGQGGHDIYRSKLIGVNEWGEPENLGPVINSPADEISVFMHPNGRVLFFSSNGENSIGGFDVFKCMLGEDGKWSKPENMGMPVNTPDDDISFTMSASGEHGYFASYNNSLFGGADIQMVNFNAKDTSQTLTREDSLVAGIFIPELKSIKKMFTDSLVFQLEKNKRDSIAKVERELVAQDSLKQIQAKTAALAAAINDSLLKQQGGVNGISSSSRSGDMAYVPLNREMLDRLSEGELILTKIDLKDNAITSSTDTADAEKKKQEINYLQNKTLSPLALLADRDIQLSELSTDLTARLNKKELEQLLQNADVDKIYISASVPAVAAMVGQNNTNAGGMTADVLNQFSAAGNNGNASVIGEDGLQYVPLTAYMLDLIDDNQPVVSKVYLKDNEITLSTDHAKADQKIKEINNLQAKVLSSLPTSNNRDLDLSSNLPEMSGTLTKKELLALLKNSDVKTIMVSTPFAVVLSGSATSSSSTSGSVSAQNNIIVKDGVGYIPLTKEMLERMRDGEMITARVDVKDNELSSSADPAKADQKRQEITNLQNKVLSSLPTSTDRTISSSGSSADFSVGLTKQEIDKLLHDPNVQNVLVPVSYGNTLVVNNNNNSGTTSSNGISSIDGTYSVQLKNGQTALVTQVGTEYPSAALRPLTKEALNQITDTEMKQITVMLKNNNYTDPSYIGDIARKTEEIRKQQTTVINSLDKKDITNVVLFDLVNGFAASANKKAIDQLLNDPLVDKVYFGQPALLNNAIVAKNKSSMQQGDSNIGAAIRQVVNGGNSSNTSSTSQYDPNQLTLNDIMRMRDGDRMSVVVEVKDNNASVGNSQRQQSQTTASAGDIANICSKVAATVSADPQNKISLSSQSSAFTGDLTKKDLMSLIQNQDIKSITRSGDPMGLTVNGNSNSSFSTNNNTNIQNGVNTSNTQTGTQSSGTSNTGATSNNVRPGLTLNDILQMSDSDRLNVMVEVKSDGSNVSGAQQNAVNKVSDAIQNTRSGVVGNLSKDVKNNVNVSGQTSSFTASLTKKDLLALMQRNDVSAIYKTTDGVLAVNSGTNNNTNGNVNNSSQVQGQNNATSGANTSANNIAGSSTTTTNANSMAANNTNQNQSSTNNNNANGSVNNNSQVQGQNNPAIGTNTSVNSAVGSSTLTNGNSTSTASSSSLGANGNTSAVNGNNQNQIVGNINNVNAHGSTNQSGTSTTTNNTNVTGNNSSTGAANSNTTSSSSSSQNQTTTGTTSNSGVVNNGNTAGVNGKAGTQVNGGQSSANSTSTNTGSNIQPQQGNISSTTTVNGQNTNANSGQQSSTGATTSGTIAGAGNTNSSNNQSTTGQNIAGSSVTSVNSSGSQDVGATNGVNNNQANGSSGVNGNNVNATTTGGNNSQDQNTTTNNASNNQSGTNINSSTTKNNSKSGVTSSSGNTSVATTNDGIVGASTNELAADNSSFDDYKPMTIAGQQVSFVNILFEYDKYDLDSIAKTELDKVVAYILSEKQMILSLGGYTDAKGSQAYNLMLSKKRVNSVKMYLNEKGVKNSQLIAKYFGENNPVSPNENPDGSDFPEGRQLNRRVEIRMK